MTDRPGDTAGDPAYPQGQSATGSPWQGGPSGYPGQPPSYPGQQPPAYGGGYGSAPVYPGGGYDGAAPAAGWSGWAIAAFLCSLIPFLGILAAVPLAIVALVKISKTRQRGFPAGQHSMRSLPPSALGRPQSTCRTASRRVSKASGWFRLRMSGTTTVGTAPSASP